MSRSRKRRAPARRAIAGPARPMKLMRPTRPATVALSATASRRAQSRVVANGRPRLRAPSSSRSSSARRRHSRRRSRRRGRAAAAGPRRRPGHSAPAIPPPRCRGRSPRRNGSPSASMPSEAEAERQDEAGEDHLQRREHCRAASSSTITVAAPPPIEGDDVPAEHQCSGQPQRGRDQRALGPGEHPEAVPGSASGLRSTCWNSTPARPSAAPVRAGWQ